MKPKIVLPANMIKLQVNEGGDLIVFELSQTPSAEPSEQKFFSPTRGNALHVHLVGNEQDDYILMKSFRIHSRPYRRAFHCSECGLRIILNDLPYTESSLKYDIFGNFNSQ